MVQTIRVSERFGPFSCPSRDRHRFGKPSDLGEGEHLPVRGR